MEQYKEQRKRIKDTPKKELLAKLKSEADLVRKTVRASVVHAACGIADVSRYECYLEIAFGLRKPADDWTKGLHHYGNQHEYAAVGYVEDVTGRLFFHTGERQKLYRKGRWTCHPDGEDDEVITEVKSRAPELPAYKVGDKNWVKHMPQIQQNLYLTDRDVCFFACYVREGGSRLWKVWRDDEYIHQMHKLLDKFHSYLDGEELCPTRLNRKPKLPEVKYRLVDGPEEKPEPKEEPVKTDAERVTFLAIHEAMCINSVEDLNAMEEEMFMAYPKHSQAILAGTKKRREFLEDESAYEF
jgi:hypothetical protein